MKYLTNLVSHFRSKCRECVAVTGVSGTVTGDSRRGGRQTFGYGG